MGVVRWMKDGKREGRAGMQDGWVEVRAFFFAAKASRGSRCTRRSQRICLTQQPKHPRKTPASAREAKTPTHKECTPASRVCGLPA